MAKLMIVDDSKLIRQKIARQCDSGAFRVVCSAKNGQEAITLFRDHSPEIVTMDLTMPTLDGIQCIKHLIRIDGDVRILVISALNDKATGIQALEEGAMGFITKPFSESDLQTALSEIMEDDF